MNKTFTRRLAAAAGAVGVALMGVTVVGGSAATAGPLPGGYASKKLVDGSTVQVRLYNESVRYPGNVANVPTSREVWVSGKVAVNVGGGAEGGTIWGGYVVGCQVNLSGVSMGGGGDLTIAGGQISNDDSGGNVGGGLSLGPGQAAYVPIIQTTSGDNTAYKHYNVEDFTFTGNKGGVAYSQEAFRVNGCAGYASARAKFHAIVSTDSVLAYVTVWGKPFSLG